MASRGTAEEVRRANLSAVLRLLYVNGPSSRAVLARATGRNRSTMASLVADLAELGLVEERDPDALGVAGRPSPVVHVRPEVAAIAVNPEVDALTIGLVGLDGAVRRVIRHGYDRIPSVAEVLSITSAVLAGMEVELAALRVVGIGVAVPGQVQTAEGVVRNAPHLGWRDEPFAAPLAALTGLPVSLANDAALGAMAEHRFGSGRGKDHLVYLNGGASGIGGGVIIAGALLGGTSGYAGEIGHIRIASSPALDSAGIAGTLESLVTRAELLAALGLDESSADRLAAALLHTPPQPALAVAHRQLAHLGSAIAAVINI
ncbi:MAG TPA: transcriptional regulator, partial [Propionibacteriaceae bacterium]|nr:transcriptional regulator [Propionibacteriaceae bacterium]